MMPFLVRIVIRYINNLARSISERLVSCRLGLVDIALAWLKSCHRTSPDCTIEGGVTLLPLDDVSILGCEIRQGCGNRQALPRKEPYPVGAVVQGNHMLGGIHWNACQSERAGVAHLDHVHLTDVQGHAR